MYVVRRCWELSKRRVEPFFRHASKASGFELTGRRRLPSVDEKRPAPAIQGVGVGECFCKHGVEKASAERPSLPQAAVHRRNCHALAVP